MKTTHHETTKKSKKKIETQIWKVRLNEKVEIKEKIFLNDFKFLLIIIITFFGLFIIALNFRTELLEEVFETVETEKIVITHIKTNKELVVSEIIRQAEMNGVDKSKSLEIAFCESSYDPKAKNPNSTAKGIYQFIDQTWKERCDGDVLNYEDNIRCFMQVYPIHPEYWEECK